MYGIKGFSGAFGGFKLLAEDPEIFVPSF